MSQDTPTPALARAPRMAQNGRAVGGAMSGGTGADVRGVAGPHRGRSALYISFSSMDGSIGLSSIDEVV